MWTPLRRIFNRSTISPDQASTSRQSDHPGLAPGQRRRSPHGNQRPRRHDPERGPVNQGPFVGVYRITCVGASAAARTGGGIATAASSGNVRLRPWHLRNRRFRVRWRGLDPVEVYDFLNRAAADLASVYAELAAAREETQRIKDALRQWQTEQAPTTYDLAAGYTITSRTPNTHPAPGNRPTNNAGHPYTGRPYADRHLIGARR